MKELKVCSNRMEAEVLKTLLMSNGIDTYINSDDTAGLRPAMAISNGVKVLVSEEDYDVAKKLLEENR